MADYRYEVCEDNAGRLIIVALDESGDEARAVWAATYYGEAAGSDTRDYPGESLAGADWVGLVVQGLDPVLDGWDGLGPDDLASAYYEDRWAHQIADSSDAEALPLGVDLDRCGEAGKLFAISAGAAYRCPECGETLPTVRDVHHPDTWTAPERCECCDALLD